MKNIFPSNSERARDAFEDGEGLFRKGKGFLLLKDRERAEKLCRDALSPMRSAMLLDPSIEKYRMQLHAYGRQVHDLFGCQLGMDKGSYAVSCPVMLSHSQMGFSIGASAKKICSICGEDMFECQHVKGRQYDAVIATRAHDVCNICAKKECAHEVGAKYDQIMAFSFVTDIVLDHIAIVQNPDDPLCVVQSQTLTQRDLLGMLPESEHSKFIYGSSPVQCHHCRVCDGAPRTPTDSAGSMSPVKSSSPGSGRNEPCKCGSGKKFKKCCAK
ncbi:MAG: SEC-C metal-binding domain-containing protein [Elusimicrobiota bacterium]|nr:SEC-C metal-binding domain-containing protein [Elusimicrobiota bacterium]